jgi:hypothetical protein
MFYPRDGVIQNNLLELLNGLLRAVVRVPVHFNSRRGGLPECAVDHRELPGVVQRHS